MDIDESGLRGRFGTLTLEEKVHLLTGDGLWTLRPLPKIGLGRIVMSDGPSGVRGTRWDEREPSLLFPNPSALGATWDTALAERIGRLNGAQARDKSVHVQLAPTINLHRTPLGGRHFENYSEDPLLATRIGVGFVTGVQSAGVATRAAGQVARPSSAMPCPERRAHPRPVHAQDRPFGGRPRNHATRTDIGEWRYLIGAPG